MSWQETNEEAGKCGSEELVNKLLWVTSNHDFHCCPTASGTWWQNWSSSQAWPKKDPWLSCSCSLPHEGCHMLSAPMCSPNTLFTSQVGFRLCSFYFCFSFRTFFFFWLVQVRKAISTWRLKAADTACKRAEGVCLLVLVLGRQIHTLDLSAKTLVYGTWCPHRVP